LHEGMHQASKTFCETLSEKTKESVLLRAAYQDLATAVNVRDTYATMCLSAMQDSQHAQEYTTRLETIRMELLRDVYENNVSPANQISSKTAHHRHTFLSLELHHVLMQAQAQHRNVQLCILQLQVQEDYLRAHVQERVSQDAQGSPTMLQQPLLQVLAMQEAILFEHINLQLCETDWQKQQWQPNVDDLDNLHCRRTTSLYADIQRQTLLQCGVEKQEIKHQLSFVQEALKHALTLRAFMQKSINMGSAHCPGHIVVVVSRSDFSGTACHDALALVALVIRGAHCVHREQHPRHGPGLFC